MTMISKHALSVFPSQTNYLSFLNTLSFGFYEQGHLFKSDFSEDVLVITASYLVPELLDSPVVGAVVTVWTRSLLLVPFPDLDLQVSVGLLQGTHFVQVGSQAVVEVLHRLLFASREDAIAPSKATSKATSKASPKASPIASPKAAAEAPSYTAAVAAPVATSKPRDNAGRDRVAASMDAGCSVPSSPNTHGGKPAGASTQATEALEGGGGGVLPDSGGAHGEGWRRL